MSVYTEEKKRLARLANPDLYVLGFDGSSGRSRGVADSTALVGIRLEDAWLHQLGLWEQPRGVEQWEPPRAEIEQRIETCFDSGLVVGGRMDPAGGWADAIAGWQARYRPLLWTPHLIVTGQWATQAFDMLYDAIDTKRVRVDFDRDPELKAHLLAARNRYGRVDKDHSGPMAPKMDLAAAAAYAWRAYLDATAHRPAPPAKSRRRVIAV